MNLNALEFLAGLLLLLGGGRALVAASVDAARRLHVSPLVIGLTLVAWGTSAPEVALNIISVAKGRAELAFANVIGANICNMALVLGACAMIRPLVVQERLIKVEVWLNAAVLGSLALAVTLTGLHQWHAGIMLGVFGAYSTWTIMAAVRESRHARRDAPGAVDPAALENGAPPMRWPAIAASFALGLLLLTIGGSLASDGASGLAIALGVPPAVVGVTIVAIGTTLPELGTGIIAVRKGQTDLAVGNVLGSCLFNAGALVGGIGLARPVPIGDGLLLSVAYMGVLAVALVPISRSFGKTVSRAEGILLVASYAAFVAVSAYESGAP